MTAHQLKRIEFEDCDEYNFIANPLDRVQAP